MIQNSQTSQISSSTIIGFVCTFTGMERKHLYHPFEIDFLETQEYVAKEHKNSFFEMVFILEGEGIQMINNHKLPYSNNKLFLIFPEDKHGFEVHSPTKFFFIRFNDGYLKSQSEEWIHKVEYIFHNHNHLPGCILKNVIDKPLIRALVEALMNERTNQFPQQNEVVAQLINTIITIAARNITLMDKVILKNANQEGTIALVNYIHQHIYSPDELRAEKMAEHFNLSLTYISEYFKKHVGINLQQYITDYKIKLIETRLRFTDMRINEIAFEFGFTDESHLNRIFKKYKSKSPTEYRKASQSNL